MFAFSAFNINFFYKSNRIFLFFLFFSLNCFFYNNSFASSYITTDRGNSVIEKAITENKNIVNNLDHHIENIENRKQQRQNQNQKPQNVNRKKDKYIYGGGFGGPDTASNVFFNSESLEDAYMQSEKIDSNHYKGFNDFSYKDYSKFKSLQSKVKLMKEANRFHRGDIEFGFWIGGGASFGLTAVHIFDIQELESVSNFLNFNPGISGSIFLLAKVSKTTFFGIDLNYFSMLQQGIHLFPKGDDGLQNSLGDDMAANHRFDGRIMGGIDVKNFGVKKQHILSLIFGLDGYMIDETNYYQNRFDFGNLPLQVFFEDLMSSLHRVFGLGFFGGLRLNLYAGKKVSSILDFNLHIYSGAADVDYRRQQNAAFDVLQFTFGLSFRSQTDFKISDKAWFSLIVRDRMMFLFYILPIIGVPGFNTFDNALSAFYTNNLELEFGFNFKF